MFLNLYIKINIIGRKRSEDLRKMIPKVFDISSCDRLQHPSAFPIGGICVRGTSRFLVALHMLRSSGESIEI